MPSSSLCLKLLNQPVSLVVFGAGLPSCRPRCPARLCCVINRNMDAVPLLPALLLAIYTILVCYFVPVLLTTHLPKRGFKAAARLLKTALRYCALPRSIAIRVSGFISCSGLGSLTSVPVHHSVSWILCSVLIMLPLTAAELAAASMAASNISTWTMLESAIASASGKSIVLTLSSSFAMTGYPTSGDSYSGISISGASTAITIAGNDAVFDASKHGRFFDINGGGGSARLDVSFVTFKNVSAPSPSLSLSLLSHTKPGGTPPTHELD